ncbi:Bestrophin, RFP-TM, chloride channel-domain-containing protein [Hysterangium stoloniferum]|nr:Bestrophin, RFP-TM, chloride channel-domain-containing protein [Hysterangium stoloniferum]
MNDQASSRLERVDTRFSQVLPSVDPFSPNRSLTKGFINSLLATALFRCYHIISFFTVWAACVTLINAKNVYPLNFQPTLLTVIGTVLGFVVSYRTTSSFERYNEGRRLWSQIVLHSRTLARTVWIHVPDTSAATPESQDRTPEELKSRTLVEKKTVVNLIEGFAVSVKHYLRGEEGTYYEDLWPLVKFLPAYQLPTALPPGLSGIDEEFEISDLNGSDPNATLTSPTRQTTAFPSSQLPLPNTQSLRKKPSSVTSPSSPFPNGIQRRTSFAPTSATRPSFRPLQGDEPQLLPARLPPKLSYFDVFPFSLLVKFLMKRGKDLKGRKAARVRAKLGRGRRGAIVSYNVPLEITLYLSSYISALQRRKVVDVPTTNLLIASLNGLVDSLTGLERILTTPIPFSYSIHLWVVTTIYCLALPLQIWKTMNWLTIPATSILSFIFFGFLVAGEEIENPFGYDKNDLNMDYFTHSIIRTELIAMTALPTPNPSDWAFSPLNDVVFDAHNLPTDKNASKVIERTTPDEWVSRGPTQIGEALSRGVERAPVSY